MNKYSFRVFLFLIVSVFLFSSVIAQRKTGKKIKVSDNLEVHLPISVTDKKRRFVANLTSRDFVVLENGRRQKIRSFSDGQTNPPVYAGILMDTSSSAKPKMPFFKESAANFAYTIIRSKKNKAAFMTFDDAIRLRQDFTENMDLLQRAIDKTKETGRRNSLYDALWTFCDENLRNAPGRRAMIIISDGEDASSRAKIEDVIDLAQRTETVIYTISTAAMMTDKQPTETVSSLATETGGASYFVNDMLALERALSKITQELDSQYIITYRPKNQKRDGKPRKIEVRLNGKNNKDYKVRTETKYRAVKAV